MLLAVRNILKSWLLVLALAGLFALVGWLIDGVRGLSIFVFCALLVAAGAYWSFDRVVLGMMGARELPLGEAPLLHSTVERLASRAGILKPRLYLIPDGLPIAAATGRGVRSSSLAVSTGCVAACAPAELEGVLAHEIAHVRLHDVQVQTAASVAAAVLLETSRIGGWLERSLLFVLAPVAAACVHLLVSPKREFAADRLAASLCDSPHGLADALIRLEQAAELVEFEGSPASEPMLTINPFAEEWPARLFVTHPPLADRVRRLRELDSAWRDRLRDEEAA
ncbi:MAG TPA: M48 family metalloprotease [Gaiellaceae bacterium]|nr:M48 family metalloprotease [Gaiellaceae bacterium]